MKTNARFLPFICALVLAFAAVQPRCQAQTGKPADAPLFAEKTTALPALIPFRKGRLMGYCDSTKRVIVKPKYLRTYPFVNGLGRVSNGNLSGFVNEAGKEVAKPKYIMPPEIGKEFRNGRCRVQTMGRWSSTTAGEYRSGRYPYGFLDEQGREVVKPQYAFANHFQHGLAVVSTDMYHYGHIDRDGKVVTPIEFTQNGMLEYVGQFRNGITIVEKYRHGYAMLDTLGRFVVPGYYSKITFVGEGLYALHKKGSPTNIVNYKGETVLEGAEPGQLRGGVAFVQLQNGQKGIIDRNAKIIGRFDGKYDSPIMPTHYDSLDISAGYSEGLMPLRVNTHPHVHAYVDSTGRIAIPTEFHYIMPFSQGRAKVYRHPEGYGFIDKTGKLISPLQYEMAGSFREGRAWVMKNNKYGFIDRTGKEIIPLQYQYLPNKMPDYFKNGLVVVWKDDKYGIIDTTGREVVPLKYDHIGPFKAGLAKVRLHTRYGLIDRQGREVVPPGYTVVGTNHPDIIAIQDADGKWGLLDRQGKLIFEPRYHRITYNNTAYLAVADKDNRWGLIDTRGNIIVPLKYRSVGGAFTPNGLLQVELYDEIPGSAYQYIYIDRNGTEYYE